MGKSTLFNSLLGEARAIVTSQPGTTRDFLREDIVIKGFAFHLIDTAGLGEAGNAAEKAGIERSRKIASQADGVLFMLDASRRAGPEDLALLSEFKDRRCLIVANKSDLPSKLDLDEIRKTAGKAQAYSVSALRGDNLEGLRAGIHRAFVPRAGIRDDVILHARQRDDLAGIARALEQAEGWLESGSAEELCAEELRRALDLVGRLSGEVRADDVMSEVFGRFCVGK